MEQLPTLLFPSLTTTSPPDYSWQIQCNSSDRSSQSSCQQSLNPAVPPMGFHVNAPRGRSESQFERALYQYFPGRIFTGVLMQRSIESQPYIPDFAYIDSGLNLYLDIEVDEPYSLNSQQPLHYVNCPKDQQRNQAFLNWGWTVIRFSEAQVMKTPASCCKTIASVIAQLTRDNTMMTPFRAVPTLKPERRWTFAEAQEMAARHYRKTYFQLDENSAQLSKKSKRKLKLESKSESKLESKQRSIMTAQLTFYCPECGEGPIRWQGHYVCCPNCSYDGFVL